MPAGHDFRGPRAARSGRSAAETQDLVFSRILWLDGLEEHNANTRERFVYIHGTKHEDKIGTPDSHGCIRMRNADVIELFDLVEVGTPVTVKE